jgi:hypothetical protein
MGVTDVVKAIEELTGKKKEGPEGKQAPKKKEGKSNG